MVLLLAGQAIIQSAQRVGCRIRCLAQQYLCFIGRGRHQTADHVMDVEQLIIKVADGDLQLWRHAGRQLLLELRKGHFALRQIPAVFKGVTLGIRLCEVIHRRLVLAHQIGKGIEPDQ